MSGIPDLILHFEVPVLVTNDDLTAGSTGLVPRGFLLDGCANFRGQASVNVLWIQLASVPTTSWPSPADGSRSRTAAVAH